LVLIDKIKMKYQGKIRINNGKIGFPHEKKTLKPFKENATLRLLLFLYSHKETVLRKQMRLECKRYERKMYQ